MKKKPTGINNLFFIVAAFLFVGFTECKSNGMQTSSVPADTTHVALAKPDHIIFVWMENKGFNTIIGSPEAPYINSLTKKRNIVH